MANCLVPTILFIITTFLIFTKSISKPDLKIDKDTMYYFAYDNDLLGKSMHRICPNATRIGIGYLRKYSLDFEGFSNKWKGALATMNNNKNSESYVWGAIWKITTKDFINLNNKKEKETYSGAPRTVQEQSGNKVQCAIFTLPRAAKDGLPSKVYLDTIIRGANESNLPEYYQRLLRAKKSNNYDGEVDYDSK